MLFPASVKNDTKQIFITCRELSDIKKSLINSKICGLLGTTDLKKNNNWCKIKWKSITINATLKEQREINNSTQLCFPFMTLTLNDLLNFSINLIDDNNKETEFPSNVKKISSLDFKIDIFLKWTKELDHLNLPIKLKKNKLIFY